MKRKSALFIPLAAATILVGMSLLDSAPADAQYYGGYSGRPGYGGAPPPPRMGQWGFRHRVHGYIGGQAGGMFVLAQVTDLTEGYLSHGGGAGLFGGIRLGPFVSLEANWTISFHDDALTDRTLDSLYLMTITADAKIHIPTYGPVEPYFQAGVGFAYIGASYYDCAACDSIFAKGPAFNVGGGMDFWLGPWFSLGGRILYRGLYFSEFVNPSGTTTRISTSNFINGVSVDVNGTFHF